ncbi:MAG TPA: GNAT family N-acetyltransferase [Opitutaceae bacterium]|nr:GNAT family N-acetyltransferase [Opitutaceae bacterium]
MIRPAQTSDAPQIAELFHRTVREVNAAHYTPAQIQAWAGGKPEPEKWLARLLVKRTFVYERDGRVCGFVEFEETGHIDALYVRAESQRQGVASQLLLRVETEAELLGLDRLFTEASITARPFFQARGFNVIEPQEVWYRGCTFTNYRMERNRLTQVPEPTRSVP